MIRSVDGGVSIHVKVVAVGLCGVLSALVPATELCAQSQTRGAGSGRGTSETSQTELSQQELKEVTQLGGDAAMGALADVLRGGIYTGNGLLTGDSNYKTESLGSGQENSGAAGNSTANFFGRWPKLECKSKKHEEDLWEWLGEVCNGDPNLPEDPEDRPDYVACQFCQRCKGIWAANPQCKPRGIAMVTCIRLFMKNLGPYLPYVLHCVRPEK